MQNGNRIPIYISAYQKSGSTFVTRLVGDALNSPTGGSVPSQDHREPASEGHDRPGKYIVRKGHYKIIKPGDYIGNKTVPSKHQIYLKNLKEDERVIFLVRDPRDIAVSGAFYFGISVEESLRCMRTGTGKFRYLGNWSEYVDYWIKANATNFKIHIARYEDFVREPWATMTRVLEVIEGEVRDQNRLRDAICRNTFQATKKRVEKHGDDMNLGMLQNKKLVRKGIVGDWRNHFTPQMEKDCEAWFGKTMKVLGYGIE